MTRDCLGTCAMLRPEAAHRHMTELRRILVVDDDPAIVRQVVDTLDAMMPKMNGLEVCRIVKSLASDSFIPIILVTVKGDVDSKVTGLKLGADDYLAKPFNPLELQARVDSMLRIKALQDKINI